jgi:hypothetical protein
MFTRAEYHGLTLIEATPAQQLFQDADDFSQLLEACFAVPTHAALLYADNLPPDFFDVSSQVAGMILQKLRNYGIRLAVVAVSDTTPFSRRFAELAAAERRDNAFGLFESRAAALAWLAE